MTPDRHSDADRVGHGEASLGDAQADNPPDDPAMLERDDGLDTDVDYEGDDPRPPEERGNEDPAPNAP